MRSWSQPKKIDDDDEDDASVYSDDTETSDIEDSHEEASEENRNCDKPQVETIEDVDTSDSSVEDPVLDSKELTWRLAYSGQDTSTSIRDLVPSCQYQLRVCAINSAGVSDYSCNVSMEMPASAPA